MATAHVTTGPSDPADLDLEVSAYDRVAGMVLALIALGGTAVLIMAILVLTSRIFASHPTVPITMEDIGTGDSSLGGGMELEAPLAEELGQETDLEEPAIENMLAAVADAVSSQQAFLEDSTLSDDALAGRGGSTGDGRGTGLGTGPGGTGKARHWEVHFQEGSTLVDYARQLDFFGIELGSLLPENRVAYAFHLAKKKPDSRIGPADQEQRYYLTWRKGGLEQADRELLERAGISTSGRLVLKFLPREIEAQLLELERDRAGDKATKVLATHFGVLPDGKGYKFYIINQTYR